MRWAVLLIGLAGGVQGAEEEGLSASQGVVEAREAAIVRVKTADAGTQPFTIDRRSMIERDRKVISLSLIEPGDKVEVLWRKEGAAQHAHLIRVTSWKREPRPVITAKMLLPYGNEPIVPRGRLTFSGIVTRLEEKRLTMRTRAGEEKIFDLRRDTRYKQDGALVEAAALSVPMRIFVRAGMSLDERLEIYEVIWGEILNPVQ